LAHEQEEATQRELMETFRHLMLDRQGFLRFVQDAEYMLERLGPRELERDQIGLKRTLHTLKGNAALMGLSLIAKLCHQLEDALELTGELSEQLLSDLRSRWGIISAHVHDFVGQQKVVQIPEAEYARLIAKAREHKSRQSFIDELDKWRREAIALHFERLAEQASVLAARLGKAPPEVHIQTNGIRVDSESWGPFFTELVHVVRNALDHGIEPSEERLRSGKPAQGKLTLRASIDDSSLVFEITDDGRGIDWEGIRRKAKQLHLPHTTNHDLVMALCHDGVTTKQSTTQVSGRGVGMAALEARVRERLGSISATTRAGLGTTFVMRFPLNQHPDVVTGNLNPKL